MTSGTSSRIRSASRSGSSRTGSVDAARPREITISPSQLDAQSCRLQWHWGYRQGYRSRKRPIALSMGDGIHQALERWYRDQTDMQATFASWFQRTLKVMDPSWHEEIRQLEQAADLGSAMLKAYMNEMVPRDDFTVVAVERTLRKHLPVPETGEDSPYVLVARLDLLVRDHHTGRLFSLDHKTYTRSPDPDMLQRDQQFTAQVWLGQHLADSMGLDEEVVGVIYNGLRKAERTSRTTAPLFRREKLFRTDHEIKVFLHRAYHQCHELNQPGLVIYPQPNQMRCNMCDFREPCLVYMGGGNYKILLDELFVSRRQRDTKRRPRVEGE